LLLALADSDATLVLCDDDQVDLSNLHRQVLFEASDVGRDKLEAARDALVREGVPNQHIELIHSRLLPENALELARSVDLVVEGADNFATKFLAADACHLAERPIVHGAAVRLDATVWFVPPAGGPCYRCLFEDVPSGAQMGCTEAGVLGPVVGLAGALMAELVLQALSGGEAHVGHLLSIDGRRDRLRRIAIPARASCALCGETPTISEIIETRYTAPSCAA
jgi:molybdopterin/thiamine biosynthesis adenylyltransferase